MSEQATVFVGNLSFKTTAEELQQAFEEFGAIIEVHMPMNEGKHRGFAFVKFKAQESAQKALAFDGRELDGRNLRVNMAHGKKEGGSEGRGGRGGESRGRGGFGGGAGDRGGRSGGGAGDRGGRSGGGGRGGFFG